MVTNVESCDVKTARATLGGLFVQEALKDFFLGLSGWLVVLRDIRILLRAERCDFYVGSSRRKANLRLQLALQFFLTHFSVLRNQFNTLVGFAGGFGCGRRWDGSESGVWRGNFGHA